MWILAINRFKFHGTCVKYVADFTKFPKAILNKHNSIMNSPVTCQGNYTHVTTLAPQTHHVTTDIWVREWVHIVVTDFVTWVYDHIFNSNSWECLQINSGKNFTINNLKDQFKNNSLLKLIKQVQKIFNYLEGK